MKKAVRKRLNLKLKVGKAFTVREAQRIAPCDVILEQVKVRKDKKVLNKKRKKKPTSYIKPRP